MSRGGPRRRLRWQTGWRELVGVRGVLVALALLVDVGVVAAGGTRDLADAWLVPGSAWWRLLGTRGEGPAVAAPPHSRWRAAVAQGRRFGLPELPQLGVAVGLLGTGWQASGAWERLGRQLYREDLVRLEVRRGDVWGLGARLDLRRLALSTVPPCWSAAGALGLQARLPGEVRLEVWWPLGEEPPWFGRTGLLRWLRIGRVARGRAWSVVVDRRADGTPLLQGELVLAVAPGAALGLRTEPWSGTVGLVTGWRWRGVLLRSSHLAHPDLGVSHRWGILLGGRR